MKPLKLTMTAFGSYADTTEIDFTKLGSGLYVITGDTGAGKTTIFDALVYALYGSASGSNRDGRTLHSDFVSYKTDTEVTLDFEVRGKEYRIWRRIHFKHGTKEGFDEDRVELTEKDSGKVYEKKNIVSKRINEITGLTREQFSQIIMLAQGEFRKFIDSNSEKRGDILRVLFNTEKYRQVQQVIREMNRLLNAGREKMQTEMGVIMDGFEFPENLSDEEKLKYEVNNSDLIDNLTELLKKEDTDYQNAEKSREKAEKEKTESGAELEKAKNQNARLDAAEAAEKEYRKLLEREAEIKKLKTEKERNEKALHMVYPAETELIKLRNETVRKQNEINETSELLAKAGEELKAAEAEKEKNAELSAENKKLNEKAATVKTLLPEYIKLSGTSAELETKEKRIADGRKQLEKYNEDTERTAASVTEVTARLDELGNTEKKMSDAEHILVNAKAELDKAKAAAEAVKAIAAEEKEAEKIRKEAEQLGIKTAEELNRYAGLNSLFISGQSEILRKNLNSEISEKGAGVCPVCGVKHRIPVEAEEYTGEIPDEKTVEDAKKRYEEESRRFENKNTEYSSKVSMIAERKKGLLENVSELFGSVTWEVFISDEFFNVKQNEISKKYSDAESVFEKLKKDDEARIKLSAEKDILSGKLENLKTGKSNLESEISGLESAVTVLRKTVNELSSKLVDYKTVSEAEEKINELEKAVRRNEAVINASEKKAEEARIKQTGLLSSLKEKEKEFNNRTQECAAAESSYRSLTAEHGFANEDEYHRYLNIFSTSDRESALAEKTAEINRFDNELSVTKSAAESLAKETAGYKRTDPEKLEEEMKLKTENLRKAGEEFDRIRALRSNHQKILREITEKTDKIKSVREKSRVINELHLLASATGNTEGGKVSFERWVMAKTFRQVVRHASIRLDAMTGGRLELEYRMTAEGVREKAGLEINVVDNTTGTQREIRSVSGGEAFQISMAFALGLSDVVQSRSGAVRIDSMFIDEGFGSLDDNVLARAIETLRDISVNQVGIISHVSELERIIEKKIYVKSTDHGSKVTVIS